MGAVKAVAGVCALAWIYGAIWFAGVWVIYFGAQ